MRKTKQYLAPAVAALALLLASAPSALASHGGAVTLPTGGGDLGGGVGGGGGGGGGGNGGGGGGGGVTAPGALTGTWSGVETFSNTTVNSILTITQNGSQITGSYVELVAGDSPTYKVSGTVSGSRIVLTLSQGGNPSLHPNVGLSGTVSADGNTITGLFSRFAVTLTR